MRLSAQMETIAACSDEANQCRIELQRIIQLKEGNPPCRHGVSSAARLGSQIRNPFAGTEVPLRNAMRLKLLHSPRPLLTGASRNAPILHISHNAECCFCRNAPVSQIIPDVIHAVYGRRKRTNMVFQQLLNGLPCLPVPAICS